MLDDGQVFNLNNAYRRLTDANLASSGGPLSTLPLRAQDDGQSGRLVKDYLGPDGEHLESSEDDDTFSSDDEDRGRKKAPRTLNPDAKGETSEGSSGDGRKSQSLLAAADEESTSASSLYTRMGANMITRNQGCFREVIYVSLPAVRARDY